MPFTEKQLVEAETQIAEAKRRAAITICLDFDGVLHSYSSGWHGVTEIPDEPVEGAKEAVQYILDLGFMVAVYSARSGQPGGRVAMKDWWRKHEMPTKRDMLFFPTSKPPASLFVDDRGFRFTGDWGLLLNMIDNGDFSPWYRDDAKVYPNAV